MANLKLDSNYIQSGLGTLTLAIPATVSSLQTPVVNIPFSVRCQVSVPQAVAQGAGSGSGVDQGLGVNGGVQGVGQGSNLQLGQGGKGLGFGGTAGNAYNTNGNGHGAGAGGGDVTGLARGGNGLGDGGVGQGFGPVANDYKQPIANIITPSVSANLILSQLSVVVNLNGSPVYTAPAIAGDQAQLDFKTPGILCNAGDTITVVLSSAGAQDQAMNLIKANVSVEQGE